MPAIYGGCWRNTVPRDEEHAQERAYSRRSRRRLYTPAEIGLAREVRDADRSLWGLSSLRTETAAIYC